MTEVQYWSVQLAKTVMQRFPDPDAYPYKPWSYPQGFLLWGFVKLWESTGEKRYYDYVLGYADRHVDEEGNISGFIGDSLDDMMAGSILVWAYHVTGMNRYRLACDLIRRVFDTCPRLHDGGFWHGQWCPQEMWVDGLFMGLMFIANYGRYVADEAWCFDEIARQFRLAFTHCQVANTGLLVHAWSQNRAASWADPITGRSPEVWSEGLGWYALMLVEALELFPINHPGRPQVMMQLDLLLQSLLATQDQATGLWYQMVDKGGLEDNWHDTSGSAMFVYALQKAVDLGLADKVRYGPPAEKGYRGVVSKAVINDEGLVDILGACDGLCVQDSYRAYIDFPRTVNAKEAVAAFLWAIVECEKPR
ncbi:MAG: glycoside hydrolase family 88/105 protein [Anaerolineae bacterium]